MSRVVESPEDFTIIGENIHATRIVLRNGRRATTLEDGTEAVTYGVRGGEVKLLRVPDHFKQTQAYEQGQLKHFMIAVWKGLHGGPEDREEGAAYVEFEARRQVRAGARFLDLNVDEVSYEVDEQKRSMEWLVQTVEPVSDAPLSIDSSSPEVLAHGLAACKGRAGRPMLNSIALERIETVQLAREHKARVIATAAGREGMPDDAGERSANAGELLEAILASGVPPGDVFVDALVFPIAVNSEYGGHFLDAVSAIRSEFGREIHVTGGLSNVSFGLPRRRLINDAFLHLAIERGADSGIIDPVQTSVARALALDIKSEPAKLAADMLLGQDPFCMEYIAAHRAGKLS